ncbi:uncharacterized protein LOC100834271 isoform X3 [Brachypodium distachyon]|nr:uncharacterized protein LOC100834271 isoform X3 [Brachypodium distachyon]KQK19770.1 hypothetical protein BRADI_1g50390v3 [Brachypodium distachyon]|eukprot:XP_024313121.1 uncharacterized protein LOC100834271 isoform X3 [Brachypodium distachyon]
MTVQQGLHTISVCADETSTVLDSTTVYWQKMLPNSPMPPAIVELLASSSSGRKIQNQKSQLSLWGLVRKLISFYGNNEVEKLIPFYGENNVEQIIPFYPGTKDEKNGLARIIPFYPGTKDEKNGLPKIIPFYPGTKDEKNGMPRIIPFYPGTKDDKNGLPKIIPFYPGTKDDKNGLPKIIPFYPETKDDKNGLQKIIPFYPGTKNEKNGLPKIIPFYPETKDEKNGLPKIIPFYPETKNEKNGMPKIIPFYPRSKDETNGLPRIIPFYPAGTQKDEINGLPKISMKRRTSSVQAEEDEHVTATEATEIPNHLNHFFFENEVPPHQNDAHNHIHHNHFTISNLFFLEESLTPGTTINLYILPSTSTGAALLPRAVADSIAMTTTSYPTILDTFSPVTRSMAEDIWTVLDVCEQSAMGGEDMKNQSCATSVESMAEFAASVLTGGDTHGLRAFSSPDVPAKGAMDGPRYKVTAARRATESMETMTCHDLSFPFPVFLCHSVNPTKVFEVTLEREEADQLAGAGDDGAERMEVLAICHLDTSAFEPEKMPGGIKPGEATVCHFIGKDTILWATAA